MHTVHHAYICDECTVFNVVVQMSFLVPGWCFSLYCTLQSTDHIYTCMHICTCLCATLWVGACLLVQL